MFKMYVITTTLLFSLVSGFVQIVPRDPPKPWQAALMARYIIHKSDWVSIATISTQDAIKGYPFVSLKSLSDGPETNATGIPYLYMTSMDVSGKDVESNNNVTIMATLAQSDYCKSENYDPQDPRCAKLIISGKLIKIPKTLQEYQFALDSLYERHPAMKSWPADHQFYVAKVNIEQIDVLDFFGGIKHVTIKDYFNANITTIINLSESAGRISVIDVTVD